jgi:hypothetical protein
VAAIVTFLVEEDFVAAVLAFMVILFPMQWGSL